MHRIKCSNFSHGWHAINLEYRAADQADRVHDSRNNKSFRASVVSFGGKKKLKHWQ